MPISSRSRAFSAMLAAFILLSVPLSAQTLTTLYDFKGGSDGEGLFDTLVQGADGNFYGTDFGQSPSYGNVFKITPSGTFTIVHAFTGVADGTDPIGGLVQGGDGNFYGTTSAGGAYGFGTVFKVTPSGVFSTLYAFTGGNDGGAAIRRLVQGSDGNFYGVSGAEGSAQDGTIFKITPEGAFTLLYTFTGGADGSNPFDGLVQGSDGNFYGTATQGGTGDNGTIFSITPSGTFAVIYPFTGGSDGGDPEPGLVEGSDGELYGSASGLTKTVAATFFKVTTAGTFTLLHNFTDSDDEGIPIALFLGGDGNFYGTTETGGSGFYGSIFEITSTGQFTSLYTFAHGNGTGYEPLAGLVQGADGAFYGSTLEGGTYGVGTIFAFGLSSEVAAPVQLTLSQSSVNVGTPVTLSFQVHNAFSTTMQQCYAFVSSNGTTTALGKPSGTYSATTKLYTGSATITPHAAGTYNYALTCGGQESGFATLAVLGTNTATALAASPNSLSVGQNVTLTATVTKSSGSATPTGTVTFSYGSLNLKTVTLNSSAIATYTASTNGLPPNTYPIIATYSGDANYNASTSPATPVKLEPAPTATTLTASPTSVTPPANVTLTATVTRSAAGSTGTPTGSVTFYADGSYALATVKLNSSGVATLNTSSSGIAAASYAITAKYLGDSDDTTSTSAPENVTVK